MRDILRRLGRHLTFANVVAALALFIALGGASYAALRLPKNSVSTRQIKNNAVTGPKIKTGAVDTSDLSTSLRSQLTAGVQGPAGPRGETGSTGPRGETGATGAPGPLLDKLPSGRTLRGAYAASDLAAAVGETVRDAPSFAFPVTANWTANVIPAGGPATPQCPGTVDAPEAAAGQLCVYEGFSMNAKLVVDSPSATGSDRFGWIAQVTSTATGAYQSRGTWAITEP
jgi:hypothetical protein